MSIPFTCDCGKKMSAKEEFAGRRLRCPECKRVVVIPRIVSPPAKAKAVRNVSSDELSETLTRPLTAPATMSREEMAARIGSRPVIETPPPSQTLPIDSAEHLAALFAPAAPPVPPRPRTAAPAAAPAVAPLVAPPAAPRPSLSEPVLNTVHPWVDRSLEQIATPWLPGNERLYQAGIAPARESEGPLGWLAPVLAIAGAIAAAVFLP